MSESPDRHPARETTAAGLDGDGAASEAGEHRDVARDVDDAVLQVTERLADVAVAARECVEMLGALALELRELVNERARHGDASAVDGGAPPGSLAPDILETAAREAEAAGVSLADYVREAVLAYDPPRADIEPRARGHKARREAARI